MKKVLIIDSCTDCPYFDNSYYDYNQICDKLNKKNSNPSEILKDCPLKDAEYDEDVS
jgi:hypothetical protein